MVKTFVVSLFIILYCFPATTSAQDKTRILEHGKYRMYDIKTEPIAIVSRELGDRPFINDKEVVGGPDWLKELTLGVKNISNKLIKRFEIHLIIPKQGTIRADGATLIILFQSQFERPLNADGTFASTDKTPKFLEPGEIVKVRVTGNQLRWFDDLKTKYGVNDVSEVSLALKRVVFDDGTGWFQGIPTVERGEGYFILALPAKQEK
jgi:hypothetical protein